MFPTRDVQTILFRESSTENCADRDRAHQAVDLVYFIARQLVEVPSPDECCPLEYPDEVATLEYWRVVPTDNGPYLLEGLMAGHGITSVAIAIYARTIARTAERWVILGRPLNGHLPEFDESDVIRRAAHWIVD